MTQTSRTHTTRHHSTRHTFPCPTCKRIYRQGDRFCGFCHEPLQVQCATCGHWTKANHACCPSCGASLHGVGLSFEEKRHLQRLKQTHQEGYAALAKCTRDLKAAFAGRRRTIRRLIVAGALSVGTIIALVHLLATLVSSLAGLLLLFVFLFVFHRLFLWGLPRLLGHFWRWVAPGDLAAWQREIEALEEEQVQRTVELSHTEREIAALEDSDDPEEDEWGDDEDDEDDEEEETTPRRDLLMRLKTLFPSGKRLTRATWKTRLKRN